MLRLKVRAKFPNGYTRRVQYTPSTGAAFWVTRRDGVFVNISGYINANMMFVPHDSDEVLWLKSQYMPQRGSYQTKTSPVFIKKRVRIDK